MKKIIITALAFALIVFSAAGLHLSQRELSGKLVRLHVVANSDSEEDQALKLKIRDSVLAYSSELCDGVTSAEEAELILSGSLDEIARRSQETARALGCDYPVTASLCSESFDTRYYGAFTLPAGEYSALRVTIGEGKGKNWWCVVFPPLCMSEGTEELTREASSAGLTSAELGLILSESEEYVVKLKSIEIVESILQSFK